ncbi:MAG: immunoglobulin domain-containing protein, partial [Verrucomicrobiales bacterium]|nr:immunoglobulin domain-containing protein [Verrucomicrobiales bacterium]
MTEEPFDYANWGSGEPNDGWGKEDALMFWGPPTADGKAWNDGIGPDEGFGLGYIVEYEPATGPPEILGQPQDQTAVLGATVVMEVTARGLLPLNYQWYKEGSPLVEGGRIGGVRTARLSLTNVVAADAGLYSVQLTNLLGWVASRKATLTVTSGGPVDAHTLLYLSFDETLNGAQGERPTTARGVEFVPGVVGAGAWIKKDSALVYSSLGNITAPQGTVDCWVKPSWRGGDTATYFFLNWGTDGGAVFSKDGASNLRFFFNQWRTEVGAANGVSGWPPNVWHHLAFTWRSSSPGPQRSGLKIYVDGRLFTSSSSPTAIAEPLRDGVRLQVGGDLSDSAHSLQAVLDEL